MKKSLLDKYRKNRPQPARPPLVIPSASQLAEAAATNVANLTDVRVLAERQIAIEDEIVELMKRVADASARLKQVKEIDLPTAMEAAGIKACDLRDGMKVEVKDFVTGHIKEESQSAAFDWLRKNKFGALIKNTIKVALGKGDDKKAKAIAAFLKKQKISFDRKEAVHPQTLQAFIRESLSAGRSLPPSIEVHRVPTAKIERPKDKE